MSRIRVNCVQCQECGDIIFSRAHHDYHPCSCGKTTVDGGFDYLRYSWSTMARPKILIKYIESSQKELYEDWNLMKNKFGIIKKCCKYSKKYKAKRKPTCGCTVCKEK